LENYGRRGSFSIAGAREYLPELLNGFRSFLEGQRSGLDKEKLEKTLSVPDKLAVLIRAYGNGNAPFTTDRIIEEYEKVLKDQIKNASADSEIELLDAAKEYLRDSFKSATENNKLAETSLLGYCLRWNPEMRDNMIGNLMAGTPNGKVEYDDFKTMIEKMQDTDDVADEFKKWAVGRDVDIVMAAEEALAVFANEFLPNNLSMVTDIANDVLNIHLAAAMAYGDLDYHRQARSAFEKYHSLAYAFEQIKDSDTQDMLDFRKKFKSYQESAKLKTAGMLQFGLIWGSNKEFRLVQKYEKQEDFDPDVIRTADYNYVSKAAESILAISDQNIKAKFEKALERASNDPGSGVRIVLSKDGSRRVIFCKEMRDMARVFLQFRKDNYADILAMSRGPEATLLSDTYEIMRYVEESARSEALIPFFDKKMDDIIPNNKNGGINNMTSMNFGRSWNMDAAVRGYTGQSLYRILYASYVGRNPEIVVVNPVMRILTSNSGAFPGVRSYKVAQEVFSQDVQRAHERLLTFYGKGGILQAAGDAFFTTPGEDSANFIMALAEYFYLVSTQEDWMVWLWGRPALKAESINGSEIRYTANVTRFLMDIGLFELYLNPDVGYDVKLVNDNFFNHYIYSIFSVLLLLLLPALQGFSGFAFLAPAVFFIPFSFISMQAINFMNYLRHWREEGSVLMMLITGTKDVVDNFPYYVSMIPSFLKSFLLAASEAFRFIPTVKTMIPGHLDRETRFSQSSHLEWTPNGAGSLYKKLQVMGGFGLVAGGVLLGLSMLGVITTNLIWLGPWVMIAGVVSLLLGFVDKYKQQQKQGRNIARIPIPLDGLIGRAGIISWFIGALATSGFGFAVILPYLLASIAILTGNNVNDVFTVWTKDADGRIRLQINGQNHMAMFADKPFVFKLFISAALALGIFSFITTFIFPLSAFLVVGVNILLYTMMGISIYKGAFSTINQASSFTSNGVKEFRAKALKEKISRNAEQLKKNKPSAPKDSAENLRLEADKAEAFREALLKAQERAHQLYLKWKALLAKQKYLKDKIAEAVAASVRGENKVPQTDEEYGGINLSEEHLTINIKVDGEGMPLPAQFQDAAMINIQGLTPVIRGIAPINATNMPVLAELMK
jgi:hypothetical protein